MRPRVAHGGSNGLAELRLRRLTLILALSAVLLTPASALAKPGSVPSFGAFAGYAWFGSVSSVQGSWTVPRVQPRSNPGLAATWIGAQSTTAHTAFIQIGTVEEASRGRSNFDYAVWSDVGHHYRAQPIFLVRPGDRIWARLVLAGRWTLSIKDLTSKAKARFSTPEESSSAFGQAEWLQEDPRSSSNHRAVPYPKLGEVRFGDLEVDARRPPYVALYSSWMSLGAGALAPSPLRNDSFVIQRAKPIGRAGARYLRKAALEDAATNKFLSQMNAWTEATPTAQVTAARSTFATALRVDIHALLSAHWPPGIARLIGPLVSAVRKLKAQTEIAPTMTAEGLSAWRQTWSKDGAALGHAARLLRRTLGVPQLMPTSGR